MSNRLLGALAVLLVLAASIGFAALNGGQRVVLRLGLFTLYRVPLTIVVFGAVILGMLVMLAAGIRSDLQVRKILRERLVQEGEEERARILVDRNQRDLFDPPDPFLPSLASPRSREPEPARAPEWAPGAEPPAPLEPVRTPPAGDDHDPDEPPEDPRTES